VRKSAIAIVTGIVIVLVLVVFLPLKPGEIPPIIQDQPKIEDQAQLDIETMVVDTPDLTDSVTSSDESGYDVYTDEDGVKHYSISAVDVPDIEG